MYDQDGKPSNKPFAVTNRQLSSFTSPPKSNNTDWVLIVEAPKNK